MESVDSAGADGASTDTTDFVGLLDQKGSVKLLDVFLNKETIPVTAADLAEMSGMDISTVYRRVEELCETGLVEESEDSNPTLYRLNVNHPAATGLTEAHGHLYAHLDEIQSASEQFDPESGLFHEGSPFVELFRYPTNVQMLAALLRNPEAELSAAELARAADVDRATVGDNVDVLVEVGLAEKLDPEYATGTRYALNREHPAAEGFQRAAEALAAHGTAVTDKGDSTELTTTGDCGEQAPRQTTCTEDERHSKDDHVGNTAETASRVKSVLKRVRGVAEGVRQSVPPIVEPPDGVSEAVNHGRQKHQADGFERRDNDGQLESYKEQHAVDESRHQSENRATVTGA